MTHRTLILAFALTLFTCQMGFAAPGSQANHPATGSWFGKAVQICADLNAPNCYKLTFFVSATLTADGKIVVADTLGLGQVRVSFSPQTAAHGEWVAVNKTNITADYVTMNGATLSPSTSINAFRLRWQAQALDEQTMIGYANMYLSPPIPLDWETLGSSDFPALPNEAQWVTEQPAKFVTDPTTLTAQDPLVVLKFTLKRVTPKLP